METIEILEQLLPLLQDAGEGTFWLVLFVIGKGYFTATLGVAVFAVTVVAAYKLIRRAIDKGGPVQRFADDIRLKAGCDSPYGEISSRDKVKVIELLEKGQAQ